MFKKKPKKEVKIEEPVPPRWPPLSDKLKELLREREIHDDHGLVIVGNRKDKPKFQ